MRHSELAATSHCQDSPQTRREIEETPSLERNRSLRQYVAETIDQMVSTWIYAIKVYCT